MIIKNKNVYDYFLNNKYTKWYLELIRKAIERDIKKRPRDGNETHHILPESMEKETRGKTLENLAVLTAKEHFIAHLLLTKMCKNPNYQIKMNIAFSNMVYVDQKGTRYKPCSRMYKLASKLNSEANSGDKNFWNRYKLDHGRSYYDDNISPHTKYKLEHGHGWGIGDNNSSCHYKRKHGKHWGDGENNSSVKFKEKNGFHWATGDNNVMRRPEVREKFIGENNPSFGTKLMNDGKINKRIKSEKVNEYLAQGWSLGLLKK